MGLLSVYSVCFSRMLQKTQVWLLNVLNDASPCKLSDHVHKFCIVLSNREIEIYNI